MVQIFYGDNNTIKALSKSMRSEINDDNILETAKNLCLNINDRMEQYANIKITPSIDSIYLYVWILQEQQD